MQRRLKFFDANVRVGASQTQRPETRLTERELLEELDRCGIERALAVHAYAMELNPLEGNRRLSELHARIPVLEACYIVLPHHVGEMPRGRELVEYLRRGRARAVRLCPARHRFRLAELWSGELLATLEEAGIPVLIAAEEVDYGELSQALAQHPKMKVILLRPWYRDARLLYPLLEAYPRLYIEISYYQPYLGLEHLVARFGPERLVFGSGLPDFDPCGTVAAVRWADLGWEALEAIAWRNLESLLWDGNALPGNSSHVRG